MSTQKGDQERRKPGTERKWKTEGKGKPKLVTWLRKGTFPDPNYGCGVWGNFGKN